MSTYRWLKWRQMCKTLCNSHYHHQRQCKGVILELQMLRCGVGCRSSYDIGGGGGIFTLCKIRESASGPLAAVSENINCECSENQSIRHFILGTASTRKSKQLNFETFKRKNVSPAIVLMRHHIRINIEKQLMWPSKWD